MRPFLCAGAAAPADEKRKQAEPTDKQVGQTERPRRRDQLQETGARDGDVERQRANDGQPLPFVVVVSPARRPKKKRGRRGGRRAMT